MIRKIAFAGASALALGMLGLTAAAANAAPAGPASGISPLIDYTCATGTGSTNCGGIGNANPVSGYLDTTFAETYTHIEGKVGTSSATLALTPSTPPTNGGGGLLCNDSTERALEVGIVENSSPEDTFTVDYEYGSLGEADSNGDPCENGLFTTAPQSFTAPSLVDFAPGDTIMYQVLYNPKTGWATFEAMNKTVSNHWYQSHCYVGKHQFFNEAGQGVAADTTNMAPPADNWLTGNAHVQLTDSNGVHGYLDNSAWDTIEVVSTANGTSADLPLLQPGSLHDGNFSEYAGGQVG
jgi:hypothetical protein